MKRKLTILYGFVVIVVLLWGSIVCGNAVKIFYSDGFIQQGESYDRVEVYDTPPSHTTVNMTGGYIGNISEWDSGLYTYNTSTVNISGGNVEFLRSYDLSTVNVIGGYVGDWCGCTGLELHDLSTLNVYQGGTLFGGSFNVLELMDSSRLNVFGGDAILFVMTQHFSTVNVHDGYIYGGIEPHEYSTISVYGGRVVLWGGILGNVIVPETSTVNIYGYGFVYEPKGEWRYYIDDPDNGMWTSRLTGWGIDGTPITYLGLPDPATHTNIHLIPEPNTIGLFALGALLATKKRGRNNLS